MQLTHEFMPQKPITELDGLAAIKAVSNILQKIDPRLIDHGERVAFIACELLEEGDLSLDEESLFLLSVFHDIGAYKTDEIDRMVEFETNDVHNHAIYGYMFLKYMSPLSDFAETILYHHTPWSELEKSGSAFKEYAALIHLADRIDIIFLHRDNPQLMKTLNENSNKLFRSEYIELVTSCFKNRRILEHLADGSYKSKNMDRLMRFQVSTDMAIEYLKMLVFSIDFRSENTVTHTVNTISIAMNIAQHFMLDEATQEKIYLGALLHDVGKISIPVEILEYSGRLSDTAMKIMRTHVTETENIIRGIVPDDICNIAIRHHEKLNGSGYPYRLSANELNFSQRIVAIADIVCALISRRSYKEPFSKEKTIAILHDMQGELLDSEICDYICNEFDSVISSIDHSRNSILEKYKLMQNEYEILTQNSNF